MTCMVGIMGLMAFSTGVRGPLHRSSISLVMGGREFLMLLTSIAHVQIGVSWSVS